MTANGSHANRPSPRPAEGRFEIERRGYNREQVDDFVGLSARRTDHLQDLLASALAENEQLRSELAAAQQAPAQPAHEQLSERLAQILKLAEDEARAQKARTGQETAALLVQAQQDAAASRAQARAEAEQMLACAREEAEQATASAHAEADTILHIARDQAGQLTAQARQQADASVTQAQAQAHRTLEEADARAAAINDGAPQRLQALIAQHTQTMEQLIAIRDSVTTLVAEDIARGSLDEEITAATAAALTPSGQAPAGQAPAKTNDPRPAATPGTPGPR
jgi:cell division septum initiation protein DivIVA